MALCGQHMLLPPLALAPWLPPPAQVSAFNRAFIAADSEAQQGVYTDLRACLLAGDAAGARSWVHTFCGVAGGGCI